MAMDKMPMDKSQVSTGVSAAEYPPVEEGLGTAIPRDSPDSLGAGYVGCVGYVGSVG